MSCRLLQLIVDQPCDVWCGRSAGYSAEEYPAETMSDLFAAREHRRIAVKVIDDRGNELLVVKKLSEAEEAQ